jgi:hypothetical protein
MWNHVVLGGGCERDKRLREVDGNNNREFVHHNSQLFVLLSHLGYVDIEGEWTTFFFLDTVLLEVLMEQLILLQSIGIFLSIYQHLIIRQYPLFSSTVFSKRLIQITSKKSV